MIMISLPIGLLLHFMYVQSMHDYLKRDITLKPAPFAFWCPSFLTGGHSQPFPATPSHPRPFPAIPSRSQPLQAILSHPQPFLAIPSRSQPFPAILSHSQPFPAILSLCQPFAAIANQRRASKESSAEPQGNPEPSPEGFQSSAPTLALSPSKPRGGRAPSKPSAELMQIQRGPSPKQTQRRAPSKPRGAEPQANPDGAEPQANPERAEPQANPMASPKHCAQHAFPAKLAPSGPVEFRGLWWLNPKGIKEGWIPASAGGGKMKGPRAHQAHVLRLLLLQHPRRPRLIPHTTIPIYGGGVGYRTSEGMQEALNPKP